MFPIENNHNKIIRQPHGNNTRGSAKPYMRSKTSVSKAAKKTLKHTRLKELYDEMYEEAGGMFADLAQNDLPKNMNRLYHLNRKKKLNTTH